ncbi:hypothetical protein BGZ79_006101 [Entomortierella chlamydospora]|nr:hypothetical protein BGZ79_006101 [Entomortierella chlamydospora]
MATPPQPTVHPRLLARCLYRRFRALRMASSTSGSSWKSYHSSRVPGSANSFGNNPNDDQDLDENGFGEYERLLARRRSTSYYDANRSRAPVAVVIKHDSKGRPISTWSTASSVAAQRGEELSQWSKRRDDLLKIYGRNNTNSGSFVNYDDLEEEPEQEEEAESQEQEQEERHEPDYSNKAATVTEEGRNDNGQSHDGISSVRK